MELWVVWSRLRVRWVGVCDSCASLATGHICVGDAYVAVGVAGRRRWASPGVGVALSLLTRVLSQPVQQQHR